MSILSTSKLIQNMFINEDEDEEDKTDETEKVKLDEEYYKNQCEMLFNVFSSNKKMRITYTDVDNFLTTFNVLYQQSYFNTFVEPNIQEYFCTKLNFLLLTDFILSYFKNNTIRVNINTITSAFLFNFFAQLGDFFYFINYLDVDEKFTDHLKYMIVLYMFHLDRDIIESNFCHIIEIMDDFFQNRIAPKLFEKINYKRLYDLEIYIARFEKNLKEELVDYSKDIDYNNHKYNMIIDKLFTLDINDNVKPIVSKIDIPNPKPITDYYSEDEIKHIESVMHRYNISHIQASRCVIYNQGILDYNYYYYEDDELSDSEDEIWVPTIKKTVPSIEVTDPNYDTYKKIFIFKKYQNVCNEKKSILVEIKQLCKSIKIKYYEDLFSDKHIEKLKKEHYDLQLKTIFGIFVEHDLISTYVLHSGFNTKFDLACEFGHLYIVINYIREIKGQLSIYHLETANMSPIRNEIFSYIKKSLNHYPNLKEKFKCFI